MVKNTNIRVSESKIENKSDKSFTELLEITKETNNAISKILPAQNQALQEILKELKVQKITKQTSSKHIDEEIKRIKLEEAKLRLQKLKDATQTKNTSNKPFNNDSLYKKPSSGRSGPYNDSHGDPYSSTLLSIMTGGLINPAVANILGLDKLLKKGVNKVFNGWDNARQAIRNPNTFSTEDDDINNNIKNTSEKQKSIPGKAINDPNRKLKNDKLDGINANTKNVNDNVSTKQRKSSAIEKAENAPITSRLDKIIGLLGGKNKTTNKAPKEKDKESLISKIFGIFKGILSGGMLLLGGILGGVKKLILVGLTIKAVQAAMGLVNMIKTAFGTILAAAEKIINAAKGLFGKSTPTPKPKAENNSKSKNKTKTNTKNINKTNTNSSAVNNITKNSTNAAKTVNTTSKISKIGKATKALGRTAGKVMAPIAVANMYSDAKATVKDISQYGFFNTGEMYEQEARNASVEDNLLNLLNPMKFAYNIEALTAKGLTKLFGSKKEVKAQEDYARVMKKIDAFYDNPEYKDENGLFDLTKVDPKDRGMAFDYLVDLIKKVGGDPKNSVDSATLTNDYIMNRSNFNSFYNNRMANNTPSAINTQNKQRYSIQTDPKMSEETYLSTVRNQREQNQLNQLTNTINNNISNNTTTSSPTVVNNNVNMMKDFNVYNSGPAANTLNR